jgi:hypothetical protein
MAKKPRLWEAAKREMEEYQQRLQHGGISLDRRQAIELPTLQAIRHSFVPNLNVLHGTTFEKCMSPARAGLTEVAPCAPGHPEAFAVPAVETVEAVGVESELAIHSSGEIELAKRKLIDTGILKKPYNWLLLFGLPFNVGRTLVSGTWVSNAQDMTKRMFLMVDQIRQIDPPSASPTLPEINL